MKQEIMDIRDKFLRYMGEHGYVRAGGTIDGTTGSLSLGIRESRRGERTREHETPAITVDFTPKELVKEGGKGDHKIIMRVREGLETPVSSLQALVGGAAMITRAHDWAREHGTIYNEGKESQERHFSEYVLK